MNQTQFLSHGTQRNTESLGAWRWLLDRLFKAAGPARIRLIVRNQAEYVPPGGSPVATLIVDDLLTLLTLVIDPEMAFGEGYAAGRIHVEGDLVEALEAIYTSWPSGSADTSRPLRLASRALERLQDNSRQGARNNIRRHYDLGNDFYRLWLDPQMVYTCAYFENPEANLSEAQEAKLDLVCRKLRLQAGETVVEAGCGWGALALHMAERFGVSVKAYNISHEQIVYARLEASRRGLGGRVEFIEDDYRNISGTFDVFASVGMLEHVGANHFREFGEVIHRAIGDRGRGLLHFIGRSYKADFSRWTRRRIFPGAYAPALGEAMAVLEPHRFAVYDVENLRSHYALTLKHWLERFTEAGPRVRDMYDPWFERAWRLYLAGSIAGFRTGTLQLFQIVFAGSKCSSMPLTRAPR